jgi:hypothetical protein
MRRTPMFALALMVAAGACQDETSTPFEPQFANAGTGNAGSASYEVTVYNLSTGQPFTPPLAAVHRRPVGLFAVGNAASAEVQQIAENGNLAPMLDALAGDKHVVDVVVTEGPTLPPVLPGEMVTFTVSGETGARYLSIISMLICTNDGFTGIDSVRLPQRVGDALAIDAVGYDAGTEVNTEDFADLVPPCAPLTGFTTDDTGTGASNPALAEYGVVAVHGGVAGVDDLDPGIHGWDDPVAHITIERVN